MQGYADFVACSQYLVLLCVVISGCLFVDPSPPPPIPRPATCGDGTCELGGEDCINCPDDCSCCLAMSSVSLSGVTNPGNAMGEKDGKFAVLDEQAVLILTLGADMFDDITEQDFILEGTVTSESSVKEEQCQTSSSGKGAFEIRVGPDGTIWYTVGFWTKDHNVFNLGCAVYSIDELRYIEIRGQPEAAGQLDAVIANSCRENK
ncbi:MAG: hypothetical protein V1754_07765 [Pseudomonadota bacterium]